MYAVFKVQLTSERKITDKCWKLASISLYLIFYARHVSVVTEQALLVRFGCIYVRKANGRHAVKVYFHKHVLRLLCSTHQCRDRTSFACEVRTYADVFDIPD